MENIPVPLLHSMDDCNRILNSDRLIIGRLIVRAHYVGKFSGISIGSVQFLGTYR